MNILATCQYGWPEPYPSLFPMEEIARRGHKVTAITGTPNYPMGKTYAEYKWGNKKVEKHNGINIVHVKTIPRGKNAIKRFLSYYSYSINASIKAKTTKEEYDVIYANQSSPIMMVRPAIAYAKKHNKKVVMYCMDLWPASLTVGGIKSNTKLYKHYHKVSKKIYNQVDIILITSKSFRDYLKNEFGIREEKIVYMPQYALSLFNNISTEKQKKNTFDIVFAGNVGKAQNLNVALRALELLNKEKTPKKIVFHIIGNGQDLENLKEYAKNKKIDNIIFHGRKQQSEMPKYYSMADAMFISLIDDPLISLTLPAKMQSYMSAGKPILAAANGEIANIIKDSKCGYCSNPNDAKQLYENIIKLVNNKEIKVFGKNAKNYYEKHFTKKAIIDQLENILIEYAR